MAKRSASERTEERFLASYRPSNYPRPAVTVDIVVFTIVDADLKVLLIKRDEHPFKGRWALPGGFVRVGDAQKDQGEDLDEAAARELAEETGLPRGAAFLDQLRAFGAADRDPRMRVISIAYWSLVRPTLVPLVRAGGDASVARWFSLHEARALPLAFDHGDILACAVERARIQIDLSAIAFELVPETFSIPELRAVYEVIKGAPLDAGNFRKRIQRMIADGILAPAPGKRITASKPAKVFRFRRI
jgi:8-oxo-dGTP diphosphatase